MSQHNQKKIDVFEYFLRFWGFLIIQEKLGFKNMKNNKLTTNFIDVTKINGVALGEFGGKLSEPNYIERKKILRGSKSFFQQYLYLNQNKICD